MNPAAYGPMHRGVPGAEDQASALRRLVESIAPAAPVSVEPGGTSRGACRTVAIASGKGGVGKTTLAVNLSVALAAKGLRTTLLDADLGLANADVMCGVSARSHLGHVLAGQRTLSEITLEAPGGFRLIPGASGVSAFADLDQTRLERLLLALGEVERTSDVLVVDCGAGIGRGVMTFLSAADLAVIVATPEPTSIADAYATLKSLVARGGETAAGRAGLFVNQARRAEEAEEVRQRIAGVSRRFLGVEAGWIGWAPVDNAAGNAIRARRPLLLSEPQSRAARSVRDAAGVVCDRLGLAKGESVARSSFVRRLLGM